MLHVVTEVGKPGRNERERRHFPDISNTRSKPSYRSHGRRYIPHGYCEFDDVQWRPHNQGIWNPKYTVNGPDWESRLRYIDAPKIEKRFPENEIFPEPWFPLRTYPGITRPSHNEWTFYTNGYHNGKVTKWAGQHFASMHSQREVDYDTTMGNNRKEYLIEKRNYIPCMSLGDKPYQAVEYSTGFHEMGSTLPIINFGGSGAPKPDTFVPLQELPPVKCESFKEMEQRRRFLDEIKVVQSLEDWRPASPLLPPPHEDLGRK